MLFWPVFEKEIVSFEIKPVMFAQKLLIISVYNTNLYIISKITEEIKKSKISEYLPRRFIYWVKVKRIKIIV